MVAAKPGTMPVRCRAGYPLRRRAPLRGMLLLGVLVFMAMGTLMASVASQRWADARQRDAEEELLIIGMQYRKAIESYYFRSPGVPRQFPASLKDLVEDPRFPQTVRHIRKLWPDPVDPAQDWGLIRQGDRIVGVYSQSTGQPFRSANFDPALPSAFTNAKTYKDWRFVSGVGVLPAAASGIGTNLPNPGMPAATLKR
ncbi:MAG: hypothetical protein RLY71_167 [Pseudomonadota bacterium]|jgi:type II secretory pathway pseudopilin PulG